MNVAKLLEQFRTRADDKVSPYLWLDEDVIEWLNQAEQEAALRRRLIHDSSTAAVCRIDVTAGTAVYNLHTALYEIDHIAFLIDGETEWKTLKLASTGWLDHNLARWRDLSDTPLYAVQTDTQLRLVPNPDADGTIRLECYRLPLADMATDDDTPEIHKAHHDKLVDWALYRAFSVPDSEGFDERRANEALIDFTAYFGHRPDADLRRDTRHDVPHGTYPSWI